MWRSQNQGVLDPDYDDLYRYKITVSLKDCIQQFEGSN